MTYHIFAEPTPGAVCHTASSRLLAENTGLRVWVANTLNELLPAASRMVDAMERWPGSQEPNEAGWNLAFGNPDAMFAALGRDETRAKTFAESMSFFEARPGLAIHYLVDEEAIGWGGVRKMVDIGGSHGKVSIGLARKYPSIKCVVQDFKKVIEGARPPDDVDDQVSFMAHDFFNEQPVKDADLYLLRWVLHDWSDQYAIRILRALTPALKPGNRVVINESCLPSHGTMSLYQQRFLRATDLTMKQIQNARERDEADWKTLLKGADERFQICDFKHPPGSELAIIIVGWQ